MANYIHNIKISELKKTTIGESSDVVIHCRWKLSTYREDLPDNVVIFDGATPFKVSADQIGGDFINYEDLQESDVISWVQQNALNLEDLKRKNEKQIENSLKPPLDVVKNPWNHPDLEKVSDPELTL